MRRAYTISQLEIVADRRFEESYMVIDDSETAVRNILKRQRRLGLSFQLLITLDVSRRSLNISMLCSAQLTDYAAALNLFFSNQIHVMSW